MFLSETLHSRLGRIDGVQLLHCQIVAFSFVDTIAEADWRSASARLPVNFAGRRPSKGTFSDEIISAVSDAMKRAVDHLGEHLEADFELMRPLLQALTTRQLLLLAEVEGKHEKLEDGARILRTSALSALRTSFFGQAMEAAYKGAMMESGSGSWKRQKAIINGKLSQETLFIELMRQCRSGFLALASTFHEEVKTAVAEQLKVVRGTLDMIRSEKIARESERDRAFRQRVAAELAGAEEVMDRVRAVVDSSHEQT
ncbi:hypothetical protein B0T18DRAFT_420577 [Schizothecium vesticola]|uniref:DUF7605 domain-containing protein n=1 Tax=Schizothecium vesticola TaxID=314040 RepID=A0AA40BPD3_9PEZI|nr:hypothetical protein B0T18DRAFT_420577 [Schizothecium vesticola]